MVRPVYTLKRGTFFYNFVDAEKKLQKTQALEMEIKKIIDLANIEVALLSEKCATTSNMKTRSLGTQMKTQAFEEQKLRFEAEQLRGERDRCNRENKGLIRKVQDRPR